MSARKYEAWQEGTPNDTKGGGPWFVTAPDGGHIEIGYDAKGLPDEYHARLFADAGNAALSRVPAQTKPEPDGWAFAKELSDALLRVRPLGGSELFVKRNGQFYADPQYCGQLIEDTRTKLDKEIRSRILAEKRPRPPPGTEGDSSVSRSDRGGEA